ncbi:MAG: hypothetical protein JNK55_20310 [Rubrivivax sp.]|nr:hypothetical protein [Rubrivivax sp.]
MLRFSRIGACDQPALVGGLLVGPGGLQIALELFTDFVGTGDGLIESLGAVVSRAGVGSLCCRISRSGTDQVAHFLGQRADSLGRQLNAGCLGGLQFAVPHRHHALTGLAVGVDLLLRRRDALGSGMALLLGLLFALIGAAQAITLGDFLIDGALQLDDGSEPRFVVLELAVRFFGLVERPEARGGALFAQRFVSAGRLLHSLRQRISFAPEGERLLDQVCGLRVGNVCVHVVLQLMGLEHGSRLFHRGAIREMDASASQRSRHAVVRPTLKRRVSTLSTSMLDMPPRRSSIAR